MSLKARQELCDSVRERYRASAKKGKKKILDEFAAAAGYHRKHAIRVLNGEKAEKPVPVLRRNGPPRIYTPNVQEALETVWKAADRICSKRLAPYIGTFVKSLERHGHLDLAPETRRRLLSMSAATMDRILYGVRHAGAPRPRSFPSGCPTLKAKIPVRTFDEWNEAGPGYVEADLVCHCGNYAGGSFINSLVLTDVETGWTECLPLLYKDADFVLKAFKQARSRFPFPIRGLDTDNGSEFITHKLFEYCQHEQITFTRSRPWKKNDQCFVEQKNGHVVRRLIGYDRYEGLGPAHVLDQLYKVIRLYVNFFQPSMRLLSKSRNGARTHRLYDEARTPYDRILTSAKVPRRIKTNVRRQYRGLDPVVLLAEIERLQDELWRYAHQDISMRSRASNSARNDLRKYAFASASGDGQNSGLRSKKTSEQEVKSTTPAKRTYRKSKKRKKRVLWWITRVDAFEDVWDQVKSWLDETPYLATTILLERLQAKHPGKYPDNKLRTLQRRVKAWRLSQIEAPEREFPEGDSLPDIDQIELVINFGSKMGNESVG